MTRTNELYKTTSSLLDRRAHILDYLKWSKLSGTVLHLNSILKSHSSIFQKKVPSRSVGLRISFYAPTGLMSSPTRAPHQCWRSMRELIKDARWEIRQCVPDASRISSMLNSQSDSWEEQQIMRVHTHSERGIFNKKHYCCCTCTTTNKLVDACCATAFQHHTTRPAHYWDPP